MKKLISAVIVSLFISFQLFGQLNPINNLQWTHWYFCPDNFFELGWNVPDSSADTLMGYNVYRNNELFRFQTGTILYHLETGGNCDVDFVLYSGGDFWIHVTALYNSSYEESIYVDSVHCDGYAIGVPEIENSKQHLYPNPSSGKINVTIPDLKMIYVIDQMGKITKEISSNGQLDLSYYPKGIYFIKLISEHEIYFEKLVLD